MDLAEYAAAQERLLRRLIMAIVWVMRAFFTPLGLTRRNWRNLTRGLYPVVKQYRDEAAELARQFHDANRAAQLPNVPRHDVYKDDYYPIEWFEEAVESTFDEYQRTGNYEGAITDLTNRVIKIVEDGARRTLIRAVETDTSVRLRGWARYDPEPPTCGFCTMMISRGPVYMSAETAGFKGDNLLASELWDRIERNQGEDAQLADEYMRSMMKRWHPGCTCIVVPVYKRSGYPSEAQEKAAMRIYQRARRLSEKKDYKSILKEMRKLLRNPRDDEDETNLPSVA